MQTTETNRGSLSDEQMKFYDREGYLVLERLLTDDDMAGVRAALTQKVDLIAAELVRDGLVPDAMVDVPFKYRLARLFENLTDQHFLKYGRSWRDRFPGYFDLMNNPKIVDAVESLIGSELFANPVFNARPKVPKVAAGAVPWHQDKSYWPDANANPVITVWIPLVDSTHENGCLHLIPGTHRHRVMTHDTEHETGAAFLATEPAAVKEASRKRAILPLPVPAGSAILFNDRLLHMSTPNKSDHVRWSVDLRYQPTDQDPMLGHGVGFLVRSRAHPERVATLEDWMAERPEHAVLA